MAFTTASATFTNLHYVPVTTLFCFSWALHMSLMLLYLLFKSEIVVYSSRPIHNTCQGFNPDYQSINERTKVNVKNVPIVEKLPSSFSPAIGIFQWWFCSLVGSTLYVIRNHLTSASTPIICPRRQRSTKFFTQGTF